MELYASLKITRFRCSNVEISLRTMKGGGGESRMTSKNPYCITIKKVRIQTYINMYIFGGNIILVTFGKRDCWEGGLLTFHFEPFYAVLRVLSPCLSFP